MCKCVHQLVAAVGVINTAFTHEAVPTIVLVVMRGYCATVRQHQGDMVCLQNNYIQS